MRCVIIDDEPVALEIIRSYVEKVAFLELTGSFRNSLKAIEYLQTNSVDLIFLDINMPDLTGIQFLNSITNPPPVIFTTAYSQYAVESYNYEAVDYLLKPIEFDRFLKAATKAFTQYRNRMNQKEKTDTLLIKSGTEYHQVRIDDILYVEGAGDYVTFAITGKEIMSLMSMKNALEMLPKNQFVRIHRSYIVAFPRINIIEKDQITIHKKKIPIGETYKENLDRFMHQER